MAAPTTLCNACNLPFSADSIKPHYASPLHAFNARRRVQDLAPFTPAAFARLEAREAEAAAARAAAAVDVVYICDACHKTFASAGQFGVHNSSTRHRERVKALLAERKAARRAAAAAAAAAGGEGGDEGAAAGSGGASAAAAAEDAPKEDLVISDAHCVFCWADGGDLESNLAHMRSAHSFFVPDAHACTDVSGLVLHLHERVIEDRVCLYCDSRKQYDGAEGAQQHMRDVGHCMLRYDEERHFEGVEDFYDYSGENEDEEDGEEDEEGEDGGEGGGGGKGGLYINDSGELVLPSGKVAIPRDLVLYHKQNVRLPDERASVRAATLALTYGGEGGGSGHHSEAGGNRSAAVAGARALGVGTRGNNTNVRAQRREEGRFTRFRLRIGLGQNDIRRDHFRVQTTLTGRTG